MKTLGTYSTLDCPFEESNPEKTRQLIAEAKDYLENEFSPFFFVRILSNSHDFGTYKSFEIDWDYEYSQFENFDEEDASDEDIVTHDKAVEHYDNVEHQYTEKFEKNL